MNIKKIYWKRASSLPENEVSLLWEMDTYYANFSVVGRQQIDCYV